MGHYCFELLFNKWIKESKSIHVGEIEIKRCQTTLSVRTNDQIVKIHSHPKGGKREGRWYEIILGQDYQYLQ